MSRRSRRRRHHRHVIRLDGDGLRRRRREALSAVADRIEALGALVGLMDDVTFNTVLPQDDELRRTVIRLSATTTGIMETAVDMAIALGELRLLAGLSGITLDGPELVDDDEEEEPG